jgi:nucleoside-triphosphatase
MKNILITGRPGVGKTTLILKVVDLFSLDVEGFYTQEVRNKGRRIGFELCTFGGRRGILADVRSRSPFRVGKYGVDLKPLEELGVTAIKRGLLGSNLIVVDEIGRMELYSAPFRDAILEALDADVKLLASIGPQPIPFLDRIRARADCETLEVTEENRDSIADEVLSRLLPI